MRVHVVALPHTQTTADYQFCAYTTKVRHFCRMLLMRGHEAILYSGEQNDAVCTEHVPVVSMADQARWFGDYDPTVDVWNGFQPDAPWWVEMNDAASDAIHDRSRPGDVLGIIAGRCQASLIGDHPNLVPVEWGIGYEGILPNTHHVFESYAHMHWVHGRYHDWMPDGRFFDTVIPNAVDPDDFMFADRSHSPYFLYLGRMTERKGLRVIEAIIERTGIEVTTAGQGPDRVAGAFQHQGVIRGVRRARLIANAAAVLIPTIYLEPFGGVAVEAMVSGVPVITTDWGAFTETVEDGRDGFRCRTLRAFTEAVERVQLWSPQHRRQIREHAIARFGLETVAGQYDDYLTRLATLHNTDGTPGPGWYAPSPDRKGVTSAV